MLNKLPVQTRRIVRLGAKVSRAWKLLDPQDTVLGEGDLGLTEHLIHEMAHHVSLKVNPTAMVRHSLQSAMSWTPRQLGFGFDSCTSATVAKILLDLRDGGEVIEETRAWVIEWNVWKTLGLDRLFDWGDVEDAAWVQGCSSFRLQELRDDPMFVPMANKVVDDLFQLCAAFDRREA